MFTEIIKLSHNIRNGRQSCNVPSITLQQKSHDVKGWLVTYTKYIYQH